MQGLSTAEVKKRIEEGRVNTPVKPPSKSVREIIAGNLFTYFNFIFAALAAILVLVKDYRDVTFLPIIIANTIIGIIQELRSKSVLDKLTVLNAPKSTVIRDGKERTINTDELVEGDLVIFRAGNQIPADARIVSGAVSVNESLLTGEQDEIQKSADAASPDEIEQAETPEKSRADLLSGSFIVSGECKAVLTKVGADSYISKLTLKAKAIKTGEQSEIIRGLNKIVTLAGIAIIPIAALMVFQQTILKGLPLEDSVPAMAAAIIGMIPEGLFLLASVTLAISAMRLARQQVLLHDMKSIETLARVDVLCVDKTGTITDDKMTVEEIKPLKNYDERVLQTFIKSQSADNATMKALKAHLKSAGESSDKNPAEKTRKTELKTDTVFGFSSKYKYSAAVISGQTYLLGAPEFILEKPDDDIQEYQKKGFRVLAFAETSQQLTGENREIARKDTRALAYLVLKNRVRPAAPKTFQYFKEQGVRIIVISGDNPETVSEVAKQAKIDGAENFRDAQQLKTQKDYNEALKQTAVFGRVTPEQKRKIIKTLKKQGHTVAMTGDGVNDILAMKDADCSVAMASGSDAAIQAAQMVLLESDFSKMPSIVLEGRRVVNNLQRSGSLFLVKNIYSFILSFMTLILGFRYPLLATQVSLVTMWTIGVPSFLLAQLPSKDRIEGNFVRNILKKAVVGGLADVLLLGLAVIGCRQLGLDPVVTSNVCTVAIAAVGLCYLFTVCWPLNKFRFGIFVLCVLGFIATAILTLLPTGTILEGLYGLTFPLPAFGLYLSLGLIVLAPLALNLLSFLQHFFIHPSKKVENFSAQNR